MDLEHLYAGNNRNRANFQVIPGNDQNTSPTNQKTAGSSNGQVS